MRNWITTGAFVFAGLLTAVSGLDAQANRPITFTSGGHWLVGYVGNAPQQYLGAGTAITTTRWLGGVGIYVDAKTTTRDPADETFLPDLTPDSAANYGDFFSGERSAWTSWNVALIKVISSELAVYAGAGFGTRTHYLQYADQTRERAEDGVYWVRDEANSGTYPSGIGGFFLRLGDRTIFQIGAESAPFGVTVGFHLVVL